ncbi:hypothetical protein SLEP1_g49404 [Rubroshorea leprosula]|uniref:Uncharacterized protein n=1 Tax=Rubroshorea leprosula TaxID=152421 RepID=A0AAV5M000_9ROSI|nr:hypothetical protein SLEP1_g49404 [Rubroshorea leprosula]
MIFHFQSFFNCDTLPVPIVSSLSHLSFSASAQPHHSNLTLSDSHAQI